MKTPFGFLRRRLQAWLFQRLKASDTLVLTQRNVYILPTRPGWMLAITLLVLLVASINYQLNLGYLLTFLLAGCAVVGMHVCHGNLRGLTLHLDAPVPVHAHEAVQLDIRLVSEKRSERLGIGLGVLHDDGSPASLAWTDMRSVIGANWKNRWAWQDHLKTPNQPSKKPPPAVALLFLKDHNAAGA